MTQYIGILFLCLASATITATIVSFPNLKEDSAALKIFVTTNIAWLFFFLGLKALGQ